MKTYKIKVVVTATVEITEKEFKEDSDISVPFNDFHASQYAKAVLVERLRNDPNYGSVKILEIKNE